MRELSFRGETRIREFSFRVKRESEDSRFVENENPRFFFFFIREFSFCGKRDLENSRFVKNQNRRIFFLFYPRILVLWKTGTGEFSFCQKPELENFFFIREFSFCGNGEFSFCGKRELENSRFVENRNRRIFFFCSFVYPRILVFWTTRIGNFFFFFFFHPRILVLCKQRILVRWKTGTGEFSFCGKPESENFFFFSSENSRFLENGN